MDLEDDLFAGLDSGKSRGRLQNVFSVSETTDKNPFTFSGIPEKPKKQETPETSILHANPACHLYVLEQGKYIPQGKIGIAIIGKMQTSHYHILCYKSSTEFLCTSTIYPEYSFTVQNNYAYFYDDKQRYYSVLFKTNQDALKFTFNVTIAKFKLSDGKNVISSDLAEGTGKGAIGNGYKVQVLYSGWLLQTDPGSLPKLGKMFDSNVQSNKPLSFTVGEHAVIKGWEEGVLGMKTGGKRFIVIPNHLAYGEEGRNPVIPPYSTLCFQIEVTKFKSSRKESTTKEDSFLESPKGQPDYQPPSVQQQQVQQQQPQQQQNSLLTRMQKLGAPTIFSMVDPHETEEPIVEQQVIQPQQMNQQIQPQQVINQQPQQIITQQGMNQSNSPVNQSFNQNTQFVPQQVYQPVVEQQGSFGQQGNQQSMIEMLQKQVQTLTEMLQKPTTTASTTTTTTEIKEGEKPQQIIVESKSNFKEIGELMSKMNEISDKIDNLDFTSLMKTNDREKKERLMSAPILLQNVQFLVDTNESLRKEILDERQTIDNLNEKILFLRKRALEKLDHTTDEFLQKDLENANIRITKLNQRIQELQETINNERDEYTSLKLKYDKLDHQYLNSTNDLEKMKKLSEKMNQDSVNEDDVLKNTILKLRQENEMLKSEEKEVKSNQTSLHVQLNHFKIENEKLKNSLSESKLEIKNLEKELQDEKLNQKENSKSLNDSYQEGLEKLKGIHEEEIQNLKKAYQKEFLKLKESHAEEIKKLTKESEENFESLKEQYLKKVETLKQDNSLDDTIDDLREQFKTKLSQVTKAKDEEIENLTKENEEEIANLKDMFKQKMKDLADKLKEETKEEYSDAMKSFMSSLFFTVKKKFKPDSKYYGSKLTLVLGQKVKESTLKLIEAIDGDDLDNLEMDEDNEMVESDNEEETTQPEKEEKSEDETEEEPEQIKSVEVHPEKPEETEEQIIQEIPGSPTEEIEPVQVEDTDVVEESQPEQVIPNETPVEDQPQLETKPDDVEDVKDSVDDQNSGHSNSEKDEFQSAESSPRANSGAGTNPISPILSTLTEPSVTSLTEATYDLPSPTPSEDKKEEPVEFTSPLIQESPEIKQNPFEQSIQEEPQHVEEEQKGEEIKESQNVEDQQIEEETKQIEELEKQVEESKDENEFLPEPHVEEQATEEEEEDIKQTEAVDFSKPPPVEEEQELEQIQETNNSNNTQVEETTQPSQDEEVAKKDDSDDEFGQPTPISKQSTESKPDSDDEFSTPNSTVQATPKTGLFDDSDDEFSAPPATKKQETTDLFGDLSGGEKKSSSLFGDPIQLDPLADSKPKKTSSLFDDDDTFTASPSQKKKPPTLDDLFGDF